MNEEPIVSLVLCFLLFIQCYDHTPSHKVGGRKTTKSGKPLASSFRDGVGPAGSHHVQRPRPAIDSAVNAIGLEMKLVWPQHRALPMALPGFAAAPIFMRLGNGSGCRFKRTQGKLF